MAVVSPCIEHNAFPLEVKALMAVPALATATGLVTADTTAATAVAKAKTPIPSHSVHCVLRKSCNEQICYEMSYLNCATG